MQQSTSIVISWTSIQTTGQLLQKKKFEKQTILRPTRRWSTLMKWSQQWIKDYLDNFNAIDRMSSAPFIVFSSQVDFCFMLYQLFISIADEYFEEDVRLAAVDVIKGVWAQVQNNEWNANFLRDPNAYSIDSDVLIVTNVLQAGHSLDRHVVTSYDFLFNDVLSFRDQLQFISRLRHLDRTDVRSEKKCLVRG